MTCQRVCATCDAYNESECLDTEGDHDISQADVDRILTAADKRRRYHEVESDYAWDHLRRIASDTKPIFDPQEG